jgi:agmatinase
MFDPSFDPNGEAVSDGIFGLPCSPEQARLVLVPVPFDATSSYRRGAAAAPAALLEASRQIDLRDLETGDPWRDGIAMLPIPDRIAALNVQASRLTAQLPHQQAAARARALGEINAITAQVCAWVEEQVHTWCDCGKLVGVVGGDHASPLGAIVALAQRHPGMGVLHVDAHADLRAAYQGFTHSHASIMHNVLAHETSVAKLVQVAVRDLCEAEMEAIARAGGRLRTWYDVDLARAEAEGLSFAKVTDELLRELPKEVYVSFDIDGLEPALCPHTGTPVPGGLTFRQACYMLAAVARSGRRIVGFDLCEVVPGGQSDDVDSIVGARILYKLAGWTLVTARR